MAAGGEKLPDVYRLRDKARKNLERALNAVRFLENQSYSSNPGHFGPVPVRSGHFGPGRFGPIFGVSRFGPVGAGRFGRYYYLPKLPRNTGTTMKLPERPRNMCVW